MTDLAPLYVAGEVRRWHSNPAMARIDQTNADHQGRCVQLLLMLNPSASPALVRATAFHDVGEVVGDLAGPVKRSHPALAAAHAMLETDARQRLCGPDLCLSGEEAAWLDLVDKLEATAFVILRNPAEAMRPASGWPAAQKRVLNRAEALGVRQAVSDLIDHLFSGDW